VFETNTLLFFALVALGASVQTMTGFAMGLIIMAGVTAFNIADISFSAAVVSFISLSNTLIALRHNHRNIDLDYLKWISVGLVPVLIGGVVLLNYLSDQYADALQMLLGIVIIGAGVSLMIAPEPYQERSSPLGISSCGVLGGLIAGLYSAGGAPLAYFMYRQPIELNIIRSTLLAVFAISTFWRTIVVGFAGHINMEVLTMAGISIPVVVAATMITGRYVHLVPDRLVRRLVFVLLIAVGTFLIVR
jgi:uncharacterized membrane protein YfcA